MLTSEYLDRAAAKLRQGWCQGRTSSLDGAPSPMDEANQWCLDGALYVVRLELPGDTYPLYRQISAFVEQELKAADNRTIVAFNDAPGQTQDAVVAFVESAANKARAVEAAAAAAAPPAEAPTA